MVSQKLEEKRNILEEPISIKSRNNKKRNIEKKIKQENYVV